MKFNKKKTGLALGSGAARALAHFGVIKSLYREGVRPDVVVGCSMGALVGAAYVTGHLGELENWFLEQNTTKILRHLDINFFASGGIADGNQFISFLKSQFGDYQIEELPIPFAAIACDMHSGKEVWLTQGSIWDAVRASGAYPGLLSPVNQEGQWLIDGGVVNPVPISVCRALGATQVIAVNLNNDLLMKPRKKSKDKQLFRFNNENSILGKATGKLRQSINDRIPLAAKRNLVKRRSLKIKEYEPGIMEVISTTIDVMQDRITRSRLAGDPPDALINPRLSHIGFLETDRTAEIIEEGENSVIRNIDQLQDFKIG
ncbi:patatin-like phospholipase family protein [Pleionea sp. CnH1-48]|uniref:patatin-like phospholipase family protein n=1 Tax=Pleionea sp. CnH1-48 TaxID=2954494 RepID=UPI0020972833|nr:patatin-like phospholipase family protein [Pleionea sp. CnH1-48]MCO7226461.1 patatin-like phospholipase family protein [Pleionea sp. CnH1-48]